MTKSKARADETVPGAAAPYAASRRAYLVTVYCATGQPEISFVTVQASHDSQAHRFADLPDAFDYLLRHVQVARPRGSSDGS